MEQVTFKVPGITCDGWVVSIRMAVRLREGIGNVDGDSDDRTVTVEYDAAVTNPDEIRNALEQVGYPAESIAWNWTVAGAGRVPRGIPIERCLAAARGAIRRGRVGQGAVCCIAATAAIEGEPMMPGRMKIGEVAKAAGLTTKTIRYYEELELLPEPARTDSGYRVYGDEAVSRLKFITKGRRLGLSLAEIGTVLDLHGQTNYPCPHVLALLDRKLAEIESVLADLNSFRDELGRLRESSAKRLDEAPEGEVVCGIIERGIHHEGELALAWLEGRNLTGSR